MVQETLDLGIPILMDQGATRILTDQEPRPVEAVTATTTQPLAVQEVSAVVTTPLQAAMVATPLAMIPTARVTLALATQAMVPAILVPTPTGQETLAPVTQTLMDQATPAMIPMAAQAITTVETRRMIPPLASSWRRLVDSSRTRD